MDIKSLLKDKWSSYFKKERLRLITKKSPLVIDFLENGELLDIALSGEEGKTVSLVFLYKDKRYAFFYLNETILAQKGHLLFSSSELNGLAEFFQFLEYPKLIQSYKTFKEKEREKEKIDLMIKNQTGATVSSIIFKDGFLHYTLSSEDTFKVKVE